MIYILVHRQDFINEYEDKSISKETYIGDYRVLLFKEVDIPESLNEYKRFEHSDIIQLRAEIESGIVPVISKKPKTADNKFPQFAVVPDEGNFDTVVTHNLCNKSTWVSGEDDSTWILQPSEGKTIGIIKAEIQFTHDLALAGSSVDLTYMGWHPDYPGTPVPFNVISFNSLYSMFELGNTHSHSPAIGDEMPIGLTTIHFNYVKKLVFYSNETPYKLAYLMISNSGHNEIGGTYCTAGFVIEEK